MDISKIFYMALFCILKKKIILFQHACSFLFKSLHYVQQFLNVHAISLLHFITYLVQGLINILSKTYQPVALIVLKLLVISLV